MSIIKKRRAEPMPNEEHLNESLLKIAKGAGIVLIGTLIGRAFGYDSRLMLSSKVHFLIGFS